MFPMGLGLLGSSGSSRSAAYFNMNPVSTSPSWNLGCDIMRLWYGSVVGTPAQHVCAHHRTSTSPKGSTPTYVLQPKLNDVTDEQGKHSRLDPARDCSTVSHWNALQMGSDGYAAKLMPTTPLEVESTPSLGGRCYPIFQHGKHMPFVSRFHGTTILNPTNGAFSGCTHQQ